MLIAANLGVLDEVELIRPCVEHLQMIGTDIIVVGDMRSTDGTRDILSEFESGSQLSVIDLKPGEDPLTFHQRVFEWTATTFHPDRIFSLDADEFWLPQSGSIKDIEHIARHTQIIKRFNIALRTNGPSAKFPMLPVNYDSAFIVIKRVSNAVERARDPDFRLIFTPIGPKAMLSPLSSRGFSIGGHSAIARDGTNESPVTPRDLIIAHLPYSTPERFVRKVANIRNFLDSVGGRLPQGAAWHWRRWTEIVDPEEVDAEFLRQTIDDDEFWRLLVDGTVCSVQSYFSHSKGICS